MPEVYHWHKEVVGARDGSCRTVGAPAHDASCDQHGLHSSDEHKCQAAEKHPVDRPYRCIHDLSADAIANISHEVEIWLLE